MDITLETVATELGLVIDPFLSTYWHSSPHTPEQLSDLEVEVARDGVRGLKAARIEGQKPFLYDGHVRLQRAAKLRSQWKDVPIEKPEFRAFNSMADVVDEMERCQNGRRQTDPQVFACVLLENADVVEKLKAEAKAAQKRGAKLKGELLSDPIKATPIQLPKIDRGPQRVEIDQRRHSAKGVENAPPTSSIG